MKTVHLFIDPSTDPACGAKGDIRKGILRVYSALAWLAGLVPTRPDERTVA